MTPAQLHILHHTLGVTPERREPYRNHYMAGPGHHSMALLEALEADGFMRRSKPPAFCDQDDVLFACTDAGRTYALEHLPPEPKRTRYEEFCREDGGYSFAEWLGIRRPEIEMRGPWREREYRMYRLRWDYSVEVSGDWAPTKKAAKDSYKAALKAARSVSV